MSQRQVAQAAGVSIDTVRRTELGHHEPGANALARIAAALGVELGSLFVHGDEPATECAACAHRIAPENDPAPLASTASESASGAK